MTEQSCFDLIDAYLSHLRGGFTVESSERDYCHVITPFWRPDGDHIELFAFRSIDDIVYISDEGQTFDWLFAIGMEVEGSDTRQRIIEEIVSRHGLQEKDGVISAEARENEFSQVTHRFLTALNSISHLVLARTPRGKVAFRDDVELYLLENNQTFKSGFEVRGKAVEHKVDFYLNSRRDWLVDTLTASSASRARELAQRTAFKWIDIRAAGWDKYTMVAVLDDTEDKEEYWRRPRVRRALAEYSDIIITWTSERGQLLGSLVSTEPE